MLWRTAPALISSSAKESTVLSDTGSHSRASVNYKGHCNKKVMGNLGQTLTCTGVEVDWRWRRLLGRLEIDKEVGEHRGLIYREFPYLSKILPTLCKDHLLHPRHVAEN